MSVLKSKPAYIFLINLFFLISLVFNLNNKTLVVFFVAYFAILSYLLKNFRLALAVCFINSWVILVGKSQVIELVSASQLNLPFREYGIGFDFVISLQEIIVALMGLTLLRDYLTNNKKKILFDKIGLLLLLFFLSLVVSSTLGSLIPSVSLLVSLYFLKPLLVYIFLLNLQRDDKKTLPVSIAAIASLIFYQSLVTFLQFFRQSPLGLSVEYSSDLLPYDMSLEAYTTFYRPVGTFGHANALANFLLPLLWVFLPAIFIKYKFLKFSQYIFLFGFAAFVLTLSRSAWLAFFISLMIFLYVSEKKWKLKFSIKSEVTRIFIITLPITLFFTVNYVLPRLTQSVYSFNQYGGGQARTELLKDSIDTLVKHPWFGVGMGMDIYYAYLKHLQSGKPLHQFSPEAVHNGFMQLANQAGIISLILFLLVLFTVIRKFIDKLKIQKSTIKKLFTLSLLCGFISPVINSQLQPYLPDLNQLLFVSIIFLHADLDDLI